MPKTWLLSYLLGSQRNEEYCLDTTYPARRLIDNKANPFFAKRYESIMEGCYRRYTFDECDVAERLRMEINTRQPSTHINYTDLGFVKLQLPDSAWTALTEFYEQHRTHQRAENWDRGDTHVNHWEVPTMIVDLSKSDHGRRVRESVEITMHPIMEEWLGYPAELIDVFGIRIYKQGSIVAPHVDRLPFVASAIVQIDQETSESWPLEIYDHSGKVHNVTLKPRDVLLYESHTIIHGRPFPFQGTSYASLFLHYKPFIHDELNAEHSLLGWGDQVPERVYDAWPSAEHAEQDEFNPEESSYVDSELDEEEYHSIIRTQMNNLKYAHLLSTKGDDARTGYMSLDAMFNIIAQRNIQKVFATLGKAPELLHQTDEIGWTVAFEAVRQGNLPLLEELVERGANLYAVLTNGEDLYDVAASILGEDHEVTDYLFARLRSEENEL